LRKHRTLLTVTILVLTATLLLQPVAPVNAQPQPSDYIVTEWVASVLSMVTPGGVRTPIFAFAPATVPIGVAIDSAGNYIVTEWVASVLSMVTPGGVRTPIFAFAPGTAPAGVAIVPPSPAPVGGVLTPVDKLTVLSPYLVLLVLLGAAVAVVAVRRSRRP